MSKKHTLQLSKLKKRMASYTIVNTKFKKYSISQAKSRLTSTVEKSILHYDFE